MLTSGVYAQSDSYTVTSLCEYARALYELGKIEEAKHEFSKVLIIDPDNATAKRYLQKMGLGKEDAGKLKALEDSLKAKDQELAKITEELKLKKEQLSSATAKRYLQKMDLDKEAAGKLKALEDSLQAKDAALASLGKELRLKEIELQLKTEESKAQAAEYTSQASQLKEDAGKLKALEDSLKAKDQELVKITEELKLKKEQLSSATAKRDKALMDKDAQLRELAESLKSTQSNLAQTQKLSLDKEAQFKQSQDKLKDSEDTATKADEYKTQTEELKNVMGRLQKGLQSEIDNYKTKLELDQKGLVVTVLTDILFNSGSAKILPEGNGILDSISKVLRNVPPDNHIVIEGHTDNEPIKYSGWESNWDLSIARAISVVRYLIYECGFDAERFSIQGYGEFRPVGDNSTEAGRRQNRRVEIVIQPEMTKVRPSSTPDNINSKTPSQAIEEPSSP